MEEMQVLNCAIDGIPYRVRQKTDLRWLQNYGRVFCVLDQQFSGNLCFGVEGPYGRLFIKYAGARTVNYRGRPSEAVSTLEGAMAFYQNKHPALTELLAHGPAGEGYAAVFAWRDALPLRPIPGTPGVRESVRRLPPVSSLKMLDMVFDLHAQLAGNGLVASDFHDGNVLIDLRALQAVVCDIDLYRRKPAVNDRGRMRGSSRFMAPEEYMRGAILEETTTVYNMGALAFEFFGENQERSKESWTGPGLLFPIAKKATQEAKADRFPSMRSFLDAWRAAVGLCRL